MGLYCTNMSSSYFFSVRNWLFEMRARLSPKVSASEPEIDTESLKKIITAIFLKIKYLPYFLFWKLKWKLFYSRTELSHFLRELRGEVWIAGIYSRTPLLNRRSKFSLVFYKKNYCYYNLRFKKILRLNETRNSILK